MAKVFTPEEHFPVLGDRDPDLRTLIERAYNSVPTMEYGKALEILSWHATFSADKPWLGGDPAEFASAFKTVIGKLVQEHVNLQKNV